MEEEQLVELDAKTIMKVLVNGDMPSFEHVYKYGVEGLPKSWEVEALDPDAPDAITLRVSELASVLLGCRVRDNMLADFVSLYSQGKISKEDIPKTTLDQLVILGEAEKAHVTVTARIRSRDLARMAQMSPEELAASLDAVSRQDLLAELQDKTFGLDIDPEVYKRFNESVTTLDEELIREFLGGVIPETPAPETPEVSEKPVS